MEPILNFQGAVVGGDARQIAVASALTRTFRKLSFMVIPKQWFRTLWNAV